jgi:hypothetical protein
MVEYIWCTQSHICIACSETEAIQSLETITRYSSVQSRQLAASPTSLALSLHLSFTSQAHALQHFLHSKPTPHTPYLDIGIPVGGLIYVSGGDLQHRNGADVYYKFRPASNFAYLTGVTEPGFACLLDPETQVSK